MILQQRIVLLALALLVVTEMVMGDEEINEKMYEENGMVFQEVYHKTMPLSPEQQNNHGFLRRELQELPTCQATNPRNIYVCGGGGGGAGDPCRDSGATCNGLTYDCTCSAGSTETSCSYCQVRTANAILCQVTASTITFVDLTSKLTTCSCEYIGNGQVRQNCYQPTPRPVPFPTQEPVYNRAPPGSDSGSSVVVPIQSTPPAQPQYSLTAPPKTQVQSPPVEASVSPVAPISCQAIDSFNLNLSLGGSCDAMPNYPCTCTGTTETSCSYCQVQTYNAVRCQVTGTDVTFLDPNSAVTTCLCQYRGNGQTEQYCYQELAANTVERDSSP